MAWRRRGLVAALFGLRERNARAVVGQATAAWLTSPHREAEQTRDPAAGPLKFEAYSIQIASPRSWDQS